MKKTTKKGRILIVDDDPLNVDIIQEILGDDFVYEIARSGTEALETADTFSPDIILLDIMMPDIDGYEVCRRFRADKRLSLTKIILVSAKQMLEDRLEGYRAGADDYLTKPFEPAELLAKIKVFIRLKSIEEIERLKSDLISVFSHETRTPLHAILGFAKLLLENPALPQNEKEALLHIKKSGQDMLELVDKTILLSNLRDGVRRPASNKILLSRLLQMAIERVSVESKYRNLEIEITSASEVVVDADERLLLTAFSCLLNNSFKYAKSGGRIEISIENKDDGKGGCSLSVTTEGTPLPEDKLEHLFSEFTVKDVSLHGRGTGLDLSIVKNIMELHNGTVEVFPDRNNNRNIFILTLPDERIITEE